jgi:hypothetical protein
VTLFSKTQSQKHSAPRDSIDAQTVNDLMGWPANALFGILVTAGIAEIEEGVSIR